MTRVLFVSQGRAAEVAAMGHVRALHALETGLADGAGEGVRIEHATVPPWTLPQRAFIRPVPRVPGSGYKSLRWHLARSYGARRIVKERLRTDPPDVVHVTTNQVAFLLEDLHRHVPCVPSLDSTTYDWLRLLRRLPADAPTPGDLRPLVALERRALERAPVSIAWTDTVAASARALAPRATIATLHPGLDLEAFRPARAPRGAGPARVLFVGGRWAAKGGPDLVAALEPELGRTVQLDVVTPQAPEPHAGLVTHQAAPGSSTVLELFQRADVLCLPSYTDAVPWVVLEAMACGVPVVASDIGSVPEMIGGHAGRVTTPGDVPALRAALMDVLEDPARRAEMGDAGRARMEERFDARRNTGQLLELLRRVAASGAPADRFRR